MVYILCIGPDLQELLSDEEVLQQIPVFKRLIDDKELIADEPFAVPAYAFKDFTTVWAMVQDGYDDNLDLPNPQAYIRAYIVAYDLELDEIEKFFITKLKDFYVLHLVRPQDFETLNSGQLSPNCKLRALLISWMAHDIRLGYYGTLRIANGSITTDYFTQVEIEVLTKRDLTEICFQTAVPHDKLCKVCEYRHQFHVDILARSSASPAHERNTTVNLTASTTTHTVRKPAILSPVFEVSTAWLDHSNCPEDQASLSPSTRIRHWLERSE